MIHTQKAIIRHKKLRDSGKFKQLDEVFFINGYPGYQYLLSIADNSTQVLYDVKGNPPSHTPFYLFHK